MGSNFQKQNNLDYFTKKRNFCYHETFDDDERTFIIKSKQEFQYLLTFINKTVLLNLGKVIWPKIRKSTKIVKIFRKRQLSCFSARLIFVLFQNKTVSVNTIIKSVCEYVIETQSKIWSFMSVCSLCVVFFVVLQNYSGIMNVNLTNFAHFSSYFLISQVKISKKII